MPLHRTLRLLGLLAALPVSAAAQRWTFPGRDAVVPLVPGLRPVVLATVNGKGPFRFIVETGSALSYLLPDAWRAAVGDGGGDGRMNVGLDSIGLPGARLTGLRVSRVESLGLRDIDGLLGLDAFAAVRLTLDFAGGTLHLDTDTLPAPNGRDVLALTRLAGSGFWTVPLQLADGPLSGILDTQSALSISVPPALADRFRFTTTPVTIGRARGPSIGDVPMRQGRLDGALRLGDVTFDGVLVDMLPIPGSLPQDGAIIGLRILREFVFSLDQRTGRARFARPTRHVPAPPPVRSAGLTARALPDGRRAVTDVVPGLGAARVAVAVADTVVALDGRPMAEVTDEAWRVAMQAERGALLRLRRNGTEREVRVVPVLVGF